ncbi:hypothetical protein GCM10007352_00330 [Mucilaginibacter phyllosphaerae]|nr:hypothetical protein GCM10007352_00330 [Mucilaginibacter phyllosphaerae]
MPMLIGYPANGFTAATVTFTETAITPGPAQTAFMYMATGIAAQGDTPGEKGTGDKKFKLIEKIKSPYQLI